MQKHLKFTRPLKKNAFVNVNMDISFNIERTQPPTAKPSDIISYTIEAKFSYPPYNMQTHQREIPICKTTPKSNLFQQSHIFKQ